MLFLHIKSDHVYQYMSLTIIEATMEPGVMYCAPGFEDMPFIRPASEFFDGRFKIFVPVNSFTGGYFDANGRAQFGPEDGSPVEETDEEDHAHFVSGRKETPSGSTN